MSSCDDYIFMQMFVMQIPVTKENSLQNIMEWMKKQPKNLLKNGKTGDKNVWFTN
jgi:hypothetical protein